jgi:hypothetical protein
MNEWSSFKFVIPVEISTRLIIDMCHDSSRNPDLYAQVDGLMNHLINFVNESDVCNELMMGVILQGLFCIFEGCTTTVYPNYNSVFTDADISSHFINNFSVSIGEYVESAMDDLTNHSEQLLRQEGIDTSELELDLIKGFILNDHHLNTLRENVIYQVNENNRAMMDIYQSSDVFEMLFDYLYRTGMLEDLYYTIANLYLKNKLDAYNIESGNTNIVKLPYCDNYLLTLDGSVTYRTGQEPDGYTRHHFTL